MKTLTEVHAAGEIHWVGNGFPVSSVFTYDDRGRELSPFLLLDYAAPYQFPPGNEPRGVGAHPHRGFETVTIAYQGELEHRDSTGAGGKIGPGDVQWMTAAGGIVHEEFHSRDFARAGGTLEMAQLWVNLPAKDKRAKAGYQTLLARQIPDVALPRDAGHLRIIAGRYGDAIGPARTFTPVNLWDVSLAAGNAVDLPVPDGHTTTLLVRRGDVSLNGKRKARDRDLAIFGREGDRIALKAETDAALLVMTGEPIDEPIVGQGPFVMNTRSEIEQALRDYQLGRLRA